VTSIVPEAYCDALFLLEDAPTSVLPISVSEMHLFSYLGCVLALFRGTPVGDWGYTYAVTLEGFPFSGDFEEARRQVVSGDLATIDDAGLLRPRQPQLSAEVATVSGLGSWTERRAWLRTATECALALPVGSIRHAVAGTPGFPDGLRQRRRLLEGDDVSLLYAEFELVSSILGLDAEDVLSPAVLWLSARIIREQGPAVGD
jgi:hypothetical protein